MSLGGAGTGRVEVRQRIASLIEEIGGIGSEKITDEATIDGALRMESVAFVELQVALEEEYDIQLDPIEIVELNQFGAIVDYVVSCIQAQHP